MSCRLLSRHGLLDRFRSLCVPCAVAQNGATFRSTSVGTLVIKVTTDNTLALKCVKVVTMTSVCISGYPDLYVNFMAAKNPDILK